MSKLNIKKMSTKNTTYKNNLYKKHVFSIKSKQNLIKMITYLHLLIQHISLSHDDS